jgi:hypothetical protein
MMNETFCLNGLFELDFEALLRYNGLCRHEDAVRGREAWLDDLPASLRRGEFISAHLALISTTIEPMPHAPDRVLPTKR